METLEQQPKIAVATVTMIPQQQQQQLPKPLTTTTKTQTATQRAHNPKRILKAPIQILMNLKKKRQEAAAMRTTEETTDDTNTPTDPPSKPTKETIHIARTRAESTDFDETTITEVSDVTSETDTYTKNNIDNAFRAAREDTWTQVTGPISSAKTIERPGINSKRQREEPFMPRNGGAEFKMKGRDMEANVAHGNITACGTTAIEIIHEEAVGAGTEEEAPADEDGERARVGLIMRPHRQNMHHIHHMMHMEHFEHG